MECSLSTPGSARVFEDVDPEELETEPLKSNSGQVSCETNVCEGFPTVSSERSVMALPIAGRLQFKHSRIESSASQELSVVALFGDATVFQNQNSVCHPDRGKAM
jgi:hypothetical protein